MRHDHAVVLGAGMAGLFAARVLSESFDRVTVIERDPLPDTDDDRRGVPQGRHIHGFQARGVQIVDELFPGLLDELVAAGASRVDDLSRLHFRVTGYLLTQQPQPIAPVLLATRPYLERGVRTRVAARPNVTFRDRLEVAGLRSASRAVCGVRVVPPGGGPAEDLDADLVVDATGRGSRAPVWLAELGYARPAEERIAVRVRYASQLLHLPSELRTRFAIDGRRPGHDVGAALFGCERDTWVFTVLGAERAFPGTPTRDWMLATAQSRLPAWAMDVVRSAEPMGPVARHQHPASVRRRYDRLTRLPDGLVVLGDALCAFNPIYGTGMSVAAEQALALRASLAAGSAGLPLRYLRAAARPTNNAWQLAAGSDLAYPDVEGDPTRAMRLASSYVRRVLQVAQHNPEAARRFMAVSGLVAPPSTLFGPRVLGPVVRAGLSRRPDAADVVPDVVREAAVRARL